VPIFVYRCDCGHRFERLLPRDAEAPTCPECDGATRKVPAGPSLRRSADAGPNRPAGRARPEADRVPIPWQGVVSGGPEKVKREVEFRERLQAKAVSGLRTPGGPDRQAPESGGSTSGSTSTASD
jgi:putative FmdB family regulatory protein